MNILASEHGLRAFWIAVLIAEGSMCPKCGMGTYVTSKRWARCKACGELVPRRKAKKVEVKP